MMKYIFILLLSSLLSLYAKSADTCYSVQLKSFVIKDAKNYVFEGYPPSCFLFRGKEVSSVRCGCFEKYSKAKEHQKSLEIHSQDSMIVETYKYKISAEKKGKESDAYEQELRLLFQVFSYSSDLENAYKTAQKALEHYPKSLYWHEKMAEVAMWTDRREEAVEHMMYVYKRTHSKQLEKKIFEYSLSAYQYKTAALIIEKKLKSDPSEANVQKMVSIFDLVGKPLESAELLEQVYRKDPSQKTLLTQQLEIYLNMGEMHRAEKVVKQMEKEKMHDIQSAYLISHYYFLKQEIKASYHALDRADINNSDGNLTQYYRQLSDLSWYVQKYQKAALASIEVDEREAARLVDFERIMSVYKKEDPLLAMKAALDAYEKFGQNYLFYTYVYMAIDERAYEKALLSCDRMEQNLDNTLVDEALYWMVKAELYGLLKQNLEAKKAFFKAQSLSPASEQIIQAYIWFLMEIKDEVALSQFLFKLHENKELSSSLWLAMAVGYFSIQNTDRAAYYLQRIDEHGLVTRESELLYAYVKQSQNEEGAFYKKINALYKQMNEALVAEPELARQSEFMQIYLTVSMFLVGADTFEHKLQEAKPVLKAKAYNELSLAFALRENVDEQVNFSANRLKSPEPWVRLNLALSADDRTQQQDILYLHYHILPLGDALGAAQNNKQIAFAQEIAFEGLEKNEKNSLLYDQMRQLHNEYADYFLTHTGYLDRTGMRQSYSDMYNSYYLAKGYSFETELFYGANSISDNEIFKSIPSNSKTLGFGIQKRFDRGLYKLLVGRKNSEVSYNYLSFTYNTILSRRINLEVKVDKGAEASESVYLLVGAHKNRVGLQASYALLGSSQIDAYLEKANYYANDGVHLGSGISGRLAYTYLQRAAYPDLQFTPYFSFGNYHESSGGKGIIDAMLNFEDTNVISDNFWYAGVEMSYGMQNRYDYVGVWRPFISLNPFYNGKGPKDENGKRNKYSYAFATGIGGSLFGQDNLALVIDYSESVGGTTDQLWRSYFRYKILY